MPSKRAWTRGEKWLFTAPLLFMVLATGAWLWRRGTSIRIVAPDSRYITELRFSPDGTRLAVAFRGGESASLFPVQIIDLESRSKICELETTSGNILDVAWSPDGTRLVAGYDDGAIMPNQTPRHDKKPGGSGWHHVGQFVVWDAQSGRRTGDYLCAPTSEDSSCIPMRFSADGKQLINRGKPPAIYDATTGDRLRVLTRNETVNFNDDLSLWAQLDEKRRHVQVFDAKTNRKIWESGYIKVDGINPRAPYSWQGNTLWIPPYSTSADFPDGIGTLWNGKTRKLIPPPPTRDTLGAWFSRDGQTLAFLKQQSILSTTSLQSHMWVDIIVWDLGQNRELWHRSVDWRPERLDWSPDGQWLAQFDQPELDSSCGLHIYDRQGNLHLEHKVISNAVTQWSPDSRQIALADVQNTQDREIELVPVKE